MQFDQIPTEIRKLPCLPYRLVRRANGRIGKVPIDAASGLPVNHQHAAYHLSFGAARQCAEDRKADGIGVVLDDQHVAVDLDDCLVEGQLSDLATQVMHEMHSYTEISVSGAGLKIFVQAQKPGPRCRAAEVELYGEGAYVAITGDRLTDTPLCANQQGIGRLYNRIFGPPPSSEAQPIARVQTTTLAPHAVLQKARQARNGSKFARLYDEGDVGAYPSVSEGEFALLRMLHFWIGSNEALLEEIFKGSAVYDEARWCRPAGGGQTYGALTLQRVIACGGPVYTERL